MKLSLLSSKFCFHWLEKIKRPLNWVSWILLAIGLVGGLMLAPPDFQQGQAFRIIYIHVPCAFLSLAIYSIAACAALSYLLFSLQIAEAVFLSILPFGAAFTLCALLTGSIWGKPMWGTWWIWDARLTAELILFFIYLGIMALKNTLQDYAHSSKLLAWIVLIGFLDIPIIHFSVSWWNTLHQGPTLSQFSKPNMAPEMLWPLIVCIFGFLMLFMRLAISSLQTELLRLAYPQHWTHPFFLEQTHNALSK